MPSENRLGDYLKARRTKLDAAAMSFPLGRRRTPGLRREEVAHRAHISATWYTWLEQGRGGAPSADVLDRLSRALMLTEVEREHLFLLALGRAPEVRYREVGVSARLQRVLDAMEGVPAIVRTATWEVVAWNRAARAALTDYEKLPPGGRNILRRIFCHTPTRAAQRDWKEVARFTVATFRVEVERAGAAEEVQALVQELRRASAEFDALWREHDLSTPCEGVKRLKHPVAGMLTLEPSTFAVDGRPDLSLVVFNPATPRDAERIRKLARDLKRSR
ncbi:MAG: helix-turn-helix transcriptional regulator [Verrucomicrobium sp.]|nr:helix-turn-helix transcriptional regulator [Verrucomicrobium sp.]